MADLEMILETGEVEISAQGDAEVLTLKFTEGMASWSPDDDRLELSVWLANGKTLRISGEARSISGVHVTKEET